MYIVIVEHPKDNSR